MNSKVDFSDYEFTADWFTQYVNYWELIFEALLPQPAKLLEIGSYEGRSAVWLIESFGRQNNIKLYCIDPWEDGEIEPDPWEGGSVPDSSTMISAGQRFDRNIAKCRLKFPNADITKIKKNAKFGLTNLLSEGHQSSFDFVYVDGSHKAPAVLTDLVLAFELCRVGGLIACDDYLWGYGQNPLLTPKLAIDSFVNCFSSKVAPLPAVPITQIWLRKIAL